MRRSFRTLRASREISGGKVNPRPDPDVGPTATNVSGHDQVDVLVAWIAVRLEERCSRHQLARLAIAALHDIELTPRSLQRLADRRLVQRLDRANLRLPNKTHRRSACATRLAVHVNRAGSAHRDPTAVLRAREAA